MAAQDLKSTVRKIYEIACSGDLSELEQYVHKDFSYTATSGEHAEGLENMKSLVSNYRDGFSDLKFEVQEVICEGNKVCALYRQRGKHTGTFGYINASNKEMDLPICAITTFDDQGKAVDTYEIFDSLELFRQLDALPEGMPASEEVFGTEAFQPDA